MTQHFPGVEAFSDKGQDNVVSLGEGSRVTRIVIEGHRNTIKIGARCRLAGQIVVRCNDGHIEIGEDTTSMRIMLHMHEPSRIVIGRDCMFSGGIWLDSSDNHSIIDLASGKRINPSKPITIGDHVWVGREVTILKGSVIGSHSIIGASSMVRGVIPPNCIAVGSPAKVIRTGVTWDRRRLPI
ncbi:acyltransferase [Paracoccus sp. SY]|uniref:acyltransferase n=1 Tax=Paracoccus sp. SY TaxID=1330255 RepID=UPI000CD0ABDB|nr:acyltransferase [Paracoccus sp. SY]